LGDGPRAVTSPFPDHRETVGDVEISAVADLMRAGRAGSRGWYDVLDEFEKEFADFVGTRYALARCNGMATLHAAVFAAGVKPGDEVIVSSYTWHTSIAPILHCGGAPIYCDIDPVTFTADPADIARKVSARTRAIIVTHVFGNPAKMTMSSRSRIAII
jgi:perosamine synthetase